MHRRGFTLVEVLLSLVLGLMLVVLASAVYQNLQKIGGRSLDLQKDWAMQNFVRLQFESADPTLNDRFQAVDGAADRFSFISRYSAQFGQTGRPVLVTYRYDGASGVWHYHEITIPPGWSAKDGEWRGVMQNWQTQNGAGVYRGTLWRNASKGGLEFWQPVQKQWSKQWNQSGKLPNPLRLRWQSGGEEQDLILGSGALSLSFASGF